MNEILDCEASTPLGRWLKGQLAARQLNIRQAAKMMEISYSLLWGYIHGEGAPSPRNVLKMARYFRVEPEEIGQLLPKPWEPRRPVPPEVVEPSEDETELLVAIGRADYLPPDVRALMRATAEGWYRAWKARQPAHENLGENPTS